MSETICQLRNGYGMDLSRYVVRTFKDKDSAYKWRLSHNATLKVLPGSWKAGDKVSLEVRGHTFD